MKKIIFSMKHFGMRNRGFTLVELMIVIAVITLLFVAMNSINFDSNISQRRVENFSHILSDMIRDTHQDVTIGKMSSGQLMQSRYLYATTDGGGSIERIFSGSTSTGSELKYAFPFIEGDKHYSIAQIEVSDSAMTVNYNSGSILETGKTWTSVNNLKIEFFPTGKMITTTTDSAFPQDNTILSYRITLDYKGFKRFIYGDAVVGNIMIKNYQ